MTGMQLDLTTDVVTLTERLVDIESVSRNEQAIADAVEEALRALAHLEVSRHGNTVVARTDLGRAERVVIAGHLDTVPINDNLPSRRDGGVLHGLGTCDMKGGDAVILRLAATVPEPTLDVTYILYEAEEIDSAFNGLNLLSQSHPELLAADFAILMEPSDGVVEAGCQGTLKAAVSTSGTRSHSARSWLGDNAIHKAVGVLERLGGLPGAHPRDRRADLPRGPQRGDRARWRRGQRDPRRVRGRGQLPLRPRPLRGGRRGLRARLLRRVRRRGHRQRAGCPPRPRRARRQAFVATVGGRVNPKFGWTDVARFTALGIPAVNFGPGDPSLAHRQDEHVPIAQIEACERHLHAWLGGA